jgi:hypothetical protein
MTITIIGQTSVNLTQAPAVAGDFASTNPRHTALTPAEGAFQAGQNGCTIGLFAWIDSLGNYLNNYGSGTPDAFVARTQEALITTYASPYGNTIPAGFMVGNAFDRGDFWVSNSGATAALPKMKAYANFVTGAISFNWTGNATTATTATTGATVAAGTTATLTGTITNGVLTASGVTNTIYPGSVLSGGTALAGTYVTAQLTGTVTGGAGTYSVYPSEQTAGVTATAAIPAVLNTGTMGSGTVAIGDSVVSTSVSASGTLVGAFVTANVTTNQWVLAPAQGQTAVGTVASSTIVLATNAETKWYAKSNGTQYELVKISDVV